MAYSKGPWTFEIDGANTYYLRDADGNALQCDEQYYPWVSGNEDDWKLQAAAPEMVEMLKAMFEDWGTTGPSRTEVEVILKKAGVLE